MPRAAHRLHLLDRSGEQFLVRFMLIGELVDEARISAVLEQPPHEIGEQILVPAHRRVDAAPVIVLAHQPFVQPRSEEHTSELQSLMRISYAVFCLKKKKINTI